MRLSWKGSLAHASGDESGELCQKHRTLRIGNAGGSTFDAAIATNAMLGLVEPMSCGIGGDLFAICRDAKSGTLSRLNASGRSPYSMHRDVFARQGLDQIPSCGPLSWSVPGCVDGWAELNDRFGTQTLADLLASSIEQADRGFPVTEIIAGYWSSAESRLAEWEDSAMTCLPDGRAPRQGEMFRNTQYAPCGQLSSNRRARLRRVLQIIDY